MQKMSTLVSWTSKKHNNDRVPRDQLWRVLQEYGIDGHLLAAIISLYHCSKVCVCVSSNKSKPFNVSVDLRQGCVLSPLLFIVLAYMNWIDKHSQVDEGITIGASRVNRLLFADDLALFATSEGDLQHTLQHFATACDKAGMKISIEKN